MKDDDRIKVRIEVMDDGRMRALTSDNVVLAHGQGLVELRENVERVVRARCGGEKRISLMVGGPV
jgi:hypothetical protein